MADFVFNQWIALGDQGNWDDGDASTLDVRSAMLHGTPEADDTLRDYNDVAALLVPAANNEPTATGYARYTHATQTRTKDNVNNRVDFDLDDAAFGALGNGTNNNVTDTFTLSFVTNDAGSTPVSLHDTVFTTDGSSVTIQWAAAGAYRAAG